MLEILAARARARDVLPRRRAGRGATRRCRARSSPPGTRRPALRPPSQPAAAGAVAGARGHRACAGAIEDATGVSPALYRPPYGVLNAAALRVARARGWRTLLWSHWGRDWEARATPESIAARVTDGAGEGSVLLLHDADDYGAPAPGGAPSRRCRAVLETLAARGLQAGRALSRAQRQLHADARCQRIASGLSSAVARSARRRTLTRPARRRRAPARAVPARDAHALVGRGAGRSSGCCWVYDAITNLAPLRLRVALGHARGVLQPRAVAAHRSGADARPLAGSAPHARADPLRLLRQRPLHRDARAARLAVVAARRHLSAAAQRARARST